MKKETKKKITAFIIEVFTLLFWIGLILILNFMFILSVFTWFQLGVSPNITLETKTSIINIGNVIIYIWIYVLPVGGLYLVHKLYYKRIGEEGK
jgi:hypothetical protein